MDNNKSSYLKQKGIQWAKLANVLHTSDRRSLEAAMIWTLKERSWTQSYSYPITIVKGREPSFKIRAFLYSQMHQRIAYTAQCHNTSTPCSFQNPVLTRNPKIIQMHHRGGPYIVIILTYFIMFFPACLYFYTNFNSLTIIWCICW